MRSFYTDRARRLVDVLLSRFDLHNVLAVLRAKAGTQRPADDALVRVGWLVEPLAGEILRQNELAGAVDLLARSTPDREQAGALRAAFGEYEVTEDLAALERAVVTDHVVRTVAGLAGRGPDAETLLRFARRAIDERNLLVALRLRDALASGAETEPPPSATRLPGGAIPLAVFERALERSDFRRGRRRPRRSRLAAAAATVGGERRPHGARARPGATLHRGRGRPVRHR